MSLLCSETAPSEAHTLIRSLRLQEVKRVLVSWCVTYFQKMHPSWQSPDSTHPMTKIIKRRHQMQVVVSYPHPPITVPSIPSFQRLHLRTRSATSGTDVERDETTCRSILLAILVALRCSTIPELGQTCPHLIDCDSAAPTPPDIQRGPYHCYCKGTLSCGPPRDVNAHEDRLGGGRHQAASHAPICTDLGVFFFTK